MKKKVNGLVDLFANKSGRNLERGDFFANLIHFILNPYPN